MNQPHISIIIPTLNEERYLSKTIIEVFKRASHKSEIEVLVIDAGSSDNTLKSVEDLPITLHEKSAFKFKKYKSLNFGISQARGEVVLFLDADTQLPDKFDSLIAQQMQNDKVVGGAFEFSFENPDWKLWILQLINRIRYRIGQMYYGDQAVFCRKEVALTVGGYPEKTLMESAFFCLKLKRIGKLVLIKKPIVTSPRRFKENGFFKVSWFDFSMWVRFLFHLPLEEYGQRYWQVNMKSNG